MIPELFWFYISQKFFLAKLPKINSLLLFLHFERNKKTWRTSCECASCGTRSDIWFHGNKLIISKADNGLLCLLILKLIFCESLLSCDKGGIPFRKVWIVKLKISQKFLVMKIFSQESFSHSNIIFQILGKFTTIVTILIITTRNCTTKFTVAFGMLIKDALLLRFHNTSINTIGNRYIQNLSQRLMFWMILKTYTGKIIY